jgi:hypothetical protein
MTDERLAEGDTSLRDLLRAIERAEKEHMPLPPVGMPAEEPVRSAPVMPVLSRLGDSPEAAPAAPQQFFEPVFTSTRWWERVGVNATAVAAFSIGMVAPAAVVVLAGSMVMASSPNADWASASLDKIQFDRARQPEVAGSLKSADVHQAGFLRIEGFTDLWQKLANGENQKPAPRLSTKLAIDAVPGMTVAMPIQIEGLDARMTNVRLIVRGVPEFASLTAAEPLPDGSWHVPLASAQDVMVTAYARSAQDHELTIELQSAEGAVLASATTVLKPAAEQSVPETVARADPTHQTAAPVVAPQVRPSQPASAREPVKSATTQKRTVVAAANRQRGRAERRTSPTGQMKVGLAGVQPVPKTPRIVIVDGPLPTRIGDPMPMVIAPPVQRPAVVAVEEQPVSASQQNQVWREPWARAAFSSSQ